MFHGYQNRIEMRKISRNEKQLFDRQQFAHFLFPIVFSWFFIFFFFLNPIPFSSTAVCSTEIIFVVEAALLQVVETKLVEF